MSPSSLLVYWTMVLEQSSIGSMNFKLYVDPMEDCSRSMVQYTRRLDGLMFKCASVALVYRNIPIANLVDLRPEHRAQWYRQRQCWQLRRMPARWSWRKFAQQQESSVVSDIYIYCKNIYECFGLFAINFLATLWHAVGKVWHSCRVSQSKSQIVDP